MRDYKLISDVVKEYPDMIRVYIYHEDYKQPIANPDYKKQVKASNKELSIHRSIRRTRVVISDVVLSNKFDLWCTFTFNCSSCPDDCDNAPCVCVKSRCKRYDMARCKTKMSSWLHRQKLHSPHMQYIIVPELHKDDAIHFHAMIKNYNGTLKHARFRNLQRGKKLYTKHGQPIYNLSGYRSGMSTAVPIDENVAAVSNYLQKYITKDMPLIDGKKRYWRSRGLDMPKSTINGVFVYNLQKLIKGNAPVFINEHFEVQEFRKVPGTSLVRSAQMPLLGDALLVRN